MEMLESRPSDCVCKIRFLILHYGDIAVTERCVDSILALDDADGTLIIVVDNDPGLPGTATVGDEWTQAEKWSRYATQDNVHIVVTGGTGFSAANNNAYRWIREHLDIGTIIACNNDIVFTQRDFIQRLRRYLNAYTDAIIGPDVVDYDSCRHQNPLDTRTRTKAEALRSYILNRVGLALFPILYPLLDERLQKMEQNVGNEQTAVQEMEKVVLTGACLIFTEVFTNNEQKLFSPETTFYYEEYLLARRCERKHYSMRYIPELQVLHHSGTATKGDAPNRKEQVRRMMRRTADACRIYIGDRTE